MSDCPIPEQFDVHVFAVVRLKVAGVEATSHRKAIETALSKTDLSDCFAGPESEYAEELSHFLVDVVCDDDYAQSQWYYSQDVPLMSNLARLVTWYERGRPDDELGQIIRDAREILANSV